MHILSFLAKQNTYSNRSGHFSVPPHNSLPRLILKKVKWYSILCIIKNDFIIIYLSHSSACFLFSVKCAAIVYHSSRAARPPTHLNADNSPAMFVCAPRPNCKHRDFYFRTIIIAFSITLLSLFANLDCQQTALCTLINVFGRVSSGLRLLACWIPIWEILRVCDISWHLDWKMDLNNGEHLGNLKLPYMSQFYKGVFKKLVIIIFWSYRLSDGWLWLENRLERWRTFSKPEACLDVTTV